MAKKAPEPKKRKENRPEGKTRSNAVEKTASPAESVFRVVGIGASAGGLEALQQFFSNMPSDRGVAFVIVQHLHPTLHSSMPEILSRFTKMPVRVAADGTNVEPNSVYLIPPNKNMGMQDGALYLQEPARPPAQRLPVDFFFRSLARDKGADAIGIIFSGTGTDGTLGVRAIKAELGTVFVQDPESAGYGGMPRSAIDTGLADFVLKADEMPRKLVRFIEHLTISGARFVEAAGEVKEPLQTILAVLRTMTGHDFSCYKQGTVRRRLQRRMSVNGIRDLAGYARFLTETGDEVKALVKDLLISVTNFFRDPDAFESLKAKLKELIGNRPKDADLRVWVAGCATGEEAYSIAIVISECLDELDKRLQVQIYGTDLDVNALQVARGGLYPANIAADVTPERLKRFFIKENNAYRVGKQIRENVVFAPQNLIKDPPFSRMDLVCCRNLLIYLENSVQKRLAPLLHYALKPGGILFLGPSETMGDSMDLFGMLDRKWKIYRRLDVAVPADRMRFPAASGTAFRGPAGVPLRKTTEVMIPELTEKIFLDNYAPIFAVIDAKYRLVYVRGRTGRYLEMASGQPSLSILEMAREGLRTELGSAIYRAASEKRKIVHEGVRVRNNGGFETINLTVAPLDQPGIPPGHLIVVFQEAAATGTKVRVSEKSRKHVAALEEDLKLTRENLQTTIEELEASSEELRSANEELQSNNEELQSTNEELDTSREELQSLNEEMLTVNAELSAKNELLVKANDDLKNLLNRTDIAIVFLDKELNIRSFTPATSDVFNIRDIDAGRPLDEITSRLAYGGVVGDAREVLRTLLPKEVEVQRKDKHWYTMRILPYLTGQNAVSGLVMSFLDIDKQKRAVGELASTNRLLRSFLHCTSLQEFLDDATRLIADWSGCCCVGIRALDESGNIPYVSHVGFDKDFLESECWLSVKNDQCSCIRVVTGEPEPQDIPMMRASGSFCCNDTFRFVEGLTEAEQARYRGVCVKIGYRTVGVVPLRFGDKILGAIHVADTSEGMLPPDVIDFIEAVAPIIGEGIHRFLLQGQLTQQLRSLFQEQNQLKAVLKQAPAGIVVAEAPSGRIFLSNDQANKIWHLSQITAEDVAHYAKYRGLHGDGRPYEPAEWPLARSITKGEMVLNEEIVILRDDGTTGTILVSSQPIHDDAGNIIAAVLTLYDITQLKLAEIKDQFIGMVSHELKNPLTVVIGALHTALTEGLSLEEILQLVADGLSGAEAMTDIIENLLELSRYQANRLVLQINPTSVEKVAGEVVQKLRSKSTIHRLIVDIPAGSPPVLIDNVRAERILYNLVDNAIKYSPKGGEVKVFARRRDDHLVVGVSDQGVGISPEDQPRLFQDFERLDIYSKHGIKGTGLGLKVCRILAEAHGGRMWVESEPGKGSTFLFTLPVAKQAEKT